MISVRTNHDRERYEICLKGRVLTAIPMSENAAPRRVRLACMMLSKAHRVGCDRATVQEFFRAR